MKITKRILQAKGAYASQVALFAKTFPRGAEITEAVCLSVADKFDWYWAAHNLLSPESCAKYRRVHALTYAEYQRVRALAYAEYQRVCAPAYAEYQRVCALSCEDHERVCAQTFGRLAASE
jgi:hypothetical protein